MKGLKIPTTSSRSFLSRDMVTKVRTEGMVLLGTSISAGCVAGVDREHRAGDVRGLIRAQPQARLRDLLRLSEPAEQAEHRSELLFGEPGGLERPADHRRVDRAGTDRVHADALWRGLQRCDLREPDDAVLGGDVRRVVRLR